MGEKDLENQAIIDFPESEWHRKRGFVTAESMEYDIRASGKSSWQASCTLLDLLQEHISVLKSKGIYSRYYFNKPVACKLQKYFEEHKDYPSSITLQQGNITLKVYDLTS